MRTIFRWLLVASLAVLAGCGTERSVRDAPVATPIPPSVRTLEDPRRRTVVDTALAQLGVRYKYGGNSPREGFDCSGLVKYAYDAAGMSVPRVSRDQLAATRPVPLEKAEPGDLVFFRSEDYSHVGIYLGEGRFVHAPQSGRAVEIGSFGNDWYRRRFVRAGRVSAAD
ncbi:MAG: NlpC/P60 family protein [Gammaproteobacteria bacterium]|nr:NlpC/P60 family protein [Gammaproteobacteria bacterium]